MKTGSTVLELEEEVDSCCVEEVPALELDEEAGSRAKVVLALEVTVLAPAGEPALPPNWVSTTKEEMAATITRTATVELFFVNLTKP